MFSQRAASVFIKLPEYALFVMSQRAEWHNWMSQQSFSKKWSRRTKHRIQLYQLSQVVQQNNGKEVET